MHLLFPLSFYTNYYIYNLKSSTLFCSSSILFVENERLMSASSLYSSIFYNSSYSSFFLLSNYSIIYSDAIVSYLFIVSMFYTLDWRVKIYWWFLAHFSSNPIRAPISVSHLFFMVSNLEDSSVSSYSLPSRMTFCLLF